MRVLTFDYHQAWINQLGVAGCDLDIVIGPSERSAADWDPKMSPLPPKGCLLELA